MLVFFDAEESVSVFFLGECEGEEDEGFEAVFSAF